MSEDPSSLGLPTEIWHALANRLWHATHVDKALAIIADGAIRPDAEATYTTGYCRSLGGVSLFDFREPDRSAADAFDKGGWKWLRGGQPFDGGDAIGVWFEIDPALAPPSIPATDIYAHYLANRRRDENGRLLTRDPMPFCEACRLGRIPLTAVKSVLLIDGKRLADHESVEPGRRLSEAIEDFRSRVRAKEALPVTLEDLVLQAAEHRERATRHDET